MSPDPIPAALRPPVTMDYWPHPLTAAGRTPRVHPCREGAVLAELIIEAVNGGEPDLTALDVAVALDGVAIPHAAWAATPVRPGQIITVRANMRGGDDSNPLAIVLLIGLTVLAGPLADNLGFKAGTTAFEIARATILVAGSYVVNQIAPPRLPEPEAAPERGPEIYSIAAGQNQARMYQPAMCVFGRHRVFPDLASKSYSELGAVENVYRYNYVRQSRGDGTIGQVRVRRLVRQLPAARYLLQNFDFGLGNLEVSDVKIGDTRLDAYRAQETEWSTAANDYAATPLVAGNVVTIPGGEIVADWTQRMTPPGTRAVIVDLAGNQGSYDSKGRAVSRDVPVEIQWRGDGEDWPDQQLDADDRRLYEVFRGLPTHPIRLGVRIEFPEPGRYEVRVRRGSAKSLSDSRRVDDTHWLQMTCFQPDRADYTGRTRLALRVKATEQLNGVIANLNAMVGQRVPVWRAGAWTDAPETSSNPAALLRWYCRGVRVNGRVVAGVGLADERIDHAGLGEWYERCERLGLECNAVLTAPTSHAEVIKMICQAGDAAVTWQTGRLGVIWAEPDDPVTGLFGPGNILAGSLKVVYATACAADEIAVSYLEPDNDWQPNTVRRAIPGVPVGSGSINLNLRGVTNIRQATREANLIAARQFHHRRRISFDVALEGIAVTRGDVIYLSSDLVAGGDGGRLIPAGEEFAQRTDLALSRPVARSAGEDHIIIRDPEGHLYQRVIAAAEAGEADRVTITEPLPADPGPDWLFKFYRGGDQPLKVRVIGIEPRAQGVASITVIDEVPAYYAAADGEADAFTRVARQAPAVLGITITENLVELINNRYAVQFNATLAVAGDYRGAVITAAHDGAPPMQVAMADAAGAASWIGPTSGRLEISAVPGAPGIPAGAGAVVVHEIRGKHVRPAVVNGFLVAPIPDGPRLFSWTPNEEPDISGYQIRYSRAGAGEQAWEDMEPLHEGRLTETPWETIAPGGGAWRFAIKALDYAGFESPEASFITADIPASGGQALLFVCEPAQAWPGTLQGEITRQGAASVDVYSWADTAAATWDDWTSWRLAPVNSPETPLVYTTEIIDLGTVADIQVSFESAGPDGTPLELGASFRAAQSGADIQTSEFADLPAGTFKARYFQLKWTSAASAIVGNLCWSVFPARGKEEAHNDADTSVWPHGPHGGRLVPTNLGLISSFLFTLQSTPAGWTASVAAKNPPEIQIFNAAGDPADGIVDIVLTGI